MEWWYSRLGPDGSVNVECRNRLRNQGELTVPPTKEIPSSASSSSKPSIPMTYTFSVLGSLRTEEM